MMFSLNNIRGHQTCNQQKFILGTCVVFTYLWHITFFGACMAISGYAEKDNRHALTCFRVASKSQSSKYDCEKKICN